MGAATDLAFALDPVAWARSAGFVAYPWQEGVLRSNGKGLLLNCSRQSGKSTVAALLALHGALYSPGSLSLLLSPALRQSSELFRKVIEAYRQIPEPVATVAESALRLELVNGSRIIALPGREMTVRGYSGVSLLVVDEASRVESDLYFALRPMLAVSNGRLVALSTPKGRRGWWHEVWAEGGDRWERVKVTASECPRISAEFLAEEKRSMPLAWYRSEYLCEFIDPVGAVFAYEDIRAAITYEVEPLYPGVYAS